MKRKSKAVFPSQSLAWYSQFVYRMIPGLCVAGFVMSCTSYRSVNITRLEEKHNVVVPGDMVRITLKNETIEQLKVTAVDSVRIAGVQTVVIKGNKAQQTRIVNRSEIETFQTQMPIVSGDVIRLTMRSGSIIKRMKVSALDSEKIACFKWSSSGSKWSNDLVTYQLPDIQSIEKRNISIGKTAGVIAIIVAVPLLIMGITQPVVIAFPAGSI